MKIRNKIYKFMQGRYGLDALGKALFGLYFFFFVLDLFLNGQVIVDVIMLILVIVLYYRFFSKNIYARTKENNKFLAFVKKIKNYHKEKNVILKKCHHCRKKLKLPLPSKRGIKHVVCPKCQKRNTFLIMHKLKVEVINKKEKVN